MGKIKQGILGAVSGKVGSVVGSTWNHVAYLRGFATKISDANTEEQQAQRASFKSVVRFVKPMKAFLKVAYKSTKTKMTPYNSVTSNILNECLIKSDDGAQIDYSKVLVSKGGMPVLNDISATCGVGKVSLSWSDNSELNDSQVNADDNVMSLVYNIDKAQAEFTTKKFKRSDLSGDIILPASWKGDKIVVYAGTKDKKSKDASNSVFLGEFVLE